MDQGIFRWQVDLEAHHEIWIAHVIDARELAAQPIAREVE